MRHTHTGSPGASPSSLPRCHGDIGLHPAKQAHVPQAWAHPPLLQLISHCEEDLLRTLSYQDSGTSSALPGLAPNSSVTPKVWERCSTETRAISLPPLPLSQSCALQFHLYPRTWPSQPLTPGRRMVIFRCPAWPGPAVAPGAALGCRSTARAESLATAPACTRCPGHPQSALRLSQGLRIQMWGWDISWDAAGCPVFPISPLGNKLENLPESISGDDGDSGPNSHSLVCKATRLYLGQGWIHSASPRA